MPSGAANAPQFAGEYELKAALLRQLLNYVAWPSGTPVGICVVGDDPFGDALDRAFADMRTRVRRLSANSAELGSCGLVFVAASEAAVLPPLLERLRASRALSVSDLPGFADDGGMIAMKTSARRVKLRIHLDRARRAGLHVDAKLLRLAEVITASAAASS